MPHFSKNHHTSVFHRSRWRGPKPKRATQDSESVTSTSFHFRVLRSIVEATLLLITEVVWISGLRSSILGLVDGHQHLHGPMITLSRAPFSSNFMQEEINSQRSNRIRNIAHTHIYLHRLQAVCNRGPDLKKDAGYSVEAYFALMRFRDYVYQYSSAIICRS